MAFFAENINMAYNFPRNPRKSPEETSGDPQFPGPVDIWDTIKSPLAGLWQGLGGKNLNYEQYVREKARKRRGQAPGSYSGRGLRGWLGRTITGK